MSRVSSMLGVIIINPFYGKPIERNMHFCIECNFAFCAMELCAFHMYSAPMRQAYFIYVFNLLFSMHSFKRETLKDRFVVHMQNENTKHKT